MLASGGGAALCVRGCRGRLSVAGGLRSMAREPLVRGFRQLVALCLGAVLIALLASVPTAVSSGRRVSASCSDARTAPLHPDQSALPQGCPTELGLGSSTPVRRALVTTPPPRSLFYYIKLDDEEPREVAGGPSNDGPPARLGQRPEARPET